MPTSLSYSMNQLPQDAIPPNCTASTIRRLHRNCQSCHFTVLALNDSEDPLTSLRAPEALPYETAYEPSHGFEDQQTPLSASKVPYQDHARIREKTPQRLPSPLKREADFINKWWLWEVLAWITSLISLIAIISVLAVYNGIFGRTSHTGHDLTLAGKPLPRWPYSITLNSLIAVFSTVFKACTAVPLTEGKQQQI